MAKDKKKKLPKGFVPFVKKGKKKDDDKKSKSKKLDENILKFVDMMISENYKDAHKFLEVVINDKIKKQIAEAAKNELFPKAEDKNAKFLKKEKKNSSKK